MALRDLAARLPMPLAQLVYRSLNAKSAAESHHLLYFTAEAAMKLCAASRVGVWLRDPREAGVQAAISGLVQSSTGQWATLALTTDAELGKRADRALLPFGDVLGTLSERRSWPAVASLAEATAKTELLPREIHRDVNARGLAGFFGLLSAYRNRVIGHGGHRTRPFYEEMSALWESALDELLRLPALWGDAVLAALVREPEGDRWVRLVDRAGLPMDPPATAAAVVPGSVCLVDRDEAVSIDPLLVYRRDDALFGERVGFLHRVEGSPPTLRFVDYGSGEVIEGASATDALATLLSTIGPEPTAAAEVEERASRLPPEGDALPEAIAPTRPGQQIGDHIVEEEIGRGELEVVYRARQAATSRLVALKVLRPRVAWGDAERGRFRRSAEILARCDHPNVVRILSARTTAEPLYYAMELVEGKNLRDAPPLPSPALTARLFADLADGVHHVHEKGAIHRDIKPANLVLTERDDRIVVVDFGLAKSIDTTSDPTKAGASEAGTVRYMAPEQLAGLGGGVDRRVDVYALGVVLYELLTGRPIFDAATEVELRTRVILGRPEPVRKIAPHVPAALAAIVEHAIERDPAARYPTARHLAEDLRAFGAGLPPRHARVPGLGRRWLHRLRRSRGQQALVLGAVLAAAAAGAWAWIERGTATECRADAVVERWGIPGCSVESDDPDVRIRSRLGRVVSSERLRGDALGVTGAIGGARRWRYVYGEGDRVVEAIGEDERGATVASVRFAVVGSDRIATDFLDPRGVPLEVPGTRIARRELLLDERGYTIEERFFARNGEPATDSRGALGYRRSVDARGVPGPAEPIEP